MGFVFDEHCEFHTVLILLISCLFVVFLCYFAFGRSWRYVFRVMENCQRPCARVEQPTLTMNLVKCATKFFDSITSNIADCDYLDFYENSLNFWNGNDSLILVHLNIRPLHKILTICMNLSACFPSNRT